MGKKSKAATQTQVKNLDYYMSLPYRIEIFPDVAEGGWGASIPDLPGCITCADDWNYLLLMIEDAKKCWLEAALEDGIEIKEPQDFEYG